MARQLQKDRHSSHSGYLLTNEASSRHMQSCAIKLKLATSLLPPVGDTPLICDFSPVVLLRQAPSSLGFDGRKPHHFDDDANHKRCGLPATMMSQPRSDPNRNDPDAAAYDPDPDQSQSSGAPYSATPTTMRRTGVATMAGRGGTSDATTTTCPVDSTNVLISSGISSTCQAFCILLNVNTTLSS